MAFQREPVFWGRQCPIVVKGLKNGPILNKFYRKHGVIQFFHVRFQQNCEQVQKTTILGHFFTFLEHLLTL